MKVLTHSPPHLYAFSLLQRFSAFPPQSTKCGWEQHFHAGREIGPTTSAVTTLGLGSEPAINASLSRTWLEAAPSPLSSWG